jgi:putative ABC transport system permease protein
MPWREKSPVGLRVILAFETTLLDVRYALRTFRRSPGFVLTVAATIALGLGINVALFTLFNAYVLRPIPIRDPDTLYTFTWRTRAGGVHAFSWDEYRRLREDTSVFSEVAAVQRVQTRLNGRLFRGQLVTGNYFQMLDVGTALGRPLLPGDAAVVGRNPVLVISFEAWHTIFAGRPDIVGTKIMLRGSPMEVIGVASEGFQGLGEPARDFWAPVTVASQLQEGPDLFGPERPERLTIIGRIRTGQRLSGAGATLDAWSRQMTSQQPDERKAIGVVLRSNATAIPLTPELLLVVSPLAAAFVLALLLACANVASMMLARAVARQREIGIRLSLGAARSRLIRQLLTESVLLSITAAFLGWIVSRVTIEMSLRTVYATVPQDMLELLHDVTLPVDWRVVVFMFCAALTSAGLFGLVPAIQATRSNVMLAARGEFTAELKPARLRNRLLLAQITVSTLLLVACGALLRTTVEMSAFDIGFRTSGVVAMQVVENGQSKVIAALASDPVVDAMATASSIPLNGLVPNVTIVTERGSAITAAFNDVSPGYFDLLSIPILRGRNFTLEETVSRAPVAIVSAATAQRLFGSENPIGRTMQMAGQPVRDVRIIGVAGDIVTCCIAFGQDPALIYLPAGSSTKGAVLVRVRGNVEMERRALDSRLAQIVPGGITDIHSLDQNRAASLYPFHAAALIGMALGGLALLLTVSGIYGTVSYLVTQRTKEMGIRMALGASAGAVTGLVLNQSLRIVVTGVGVGAALAVGVSRLLASRMVFMRVFDAPAFVVGVMVVVAAALAAGYMPARRAARVDLVETLRCD